jgi:hypothetical protein
MDKTNMTPTAYHPLTLMLETRERREYFDECIIQQAMAGSVFILDAGNCFNPLRLTRRIRRQTTQIQTVLDHIQVARAFTCFQVISLLEATTDPDGPVFILRLLATYTDEMVPVYERLRLLKQVDGHIQRLRRTAPVVVTIRNALFQEDGLLEWVSQLQANADEVILPTLGIQPEPATLF